MLILYFQVVTLANKAEYIDLLSTWYQRTETEAEISAMLQGVRDVVPPAVLDTMGEVLTAADLSTLIAGHETFDVADWRAHATFRGFPEFSPQIDWLQQILEEEGPAFRRRCASP
eukprot:SAG31_NODE_3199_length_4564_cov_18.467861_3_plen_115_part_00